MRKEGFFFSIIRTIFTETTGEKEGKYVVVQLSIVNPNFMSFKSNTKANFVCLHFRTINHLSTKRTFDLF